MKAAAHKVRSMQGWSPGNRWVALCNRPPRRVGPDATVFYDHLPVFGEWVDA
jgi:hypothetical protein